MATWPAHGTDPWDVELHDYIDEGDTDNTDATQVVADDLAAHIADPTGAHAASAIVTTPTAPFVGVSSQANFNELVPLVPRSSGTPWTALANYGRGAVTSGTSETFLATFQVPANSVSVGQIIELTAILQSSSTGTFTPRIRIGTAGTIAGDTAVNVSGVSAAGAANSFVIVRAFVYVVATGASNTMAAAIQGISTAASFTNATAAEALGNVNTAAQFFITFAGTASAGTYTVRAMNLKLIP